MVRRAGALALLACAACGETNIQAIHRLQPVYAAYRGELSAALARVPPPDEPLVEHVPHSMSPPVVFLEEELHDPQATAEIMQLDEDEPPDRTMRLVLRSALGFCLAWTGPANPLSPKVWDRRQGLGEECAAALARPWLIVVRTVEQRIPEHLRMAAFVVHMPSKRVVAALPIEVFGQRATSEPYNGLSRELDAQIRSQFYVAARCELSAQLSRLPGARIHFERSACGGAHGSAAVPASRLPRKPAPTAIPEM